MNTRSDEEEQVLTFDLQYIEYVRLQQVGEALRGLRNCV